MAAVRAHARGGVGMKYHECSTCGLAWRCDAERHGRPCDLPEIVVCNDCRGLA